MIVASQSWRNDAGSQSALTSRIQLRREITDPYWVMKQSYSGGGGDIKYPYYFFRWDDP